MTLALSVRNISKQVYIFLLLLHHHHHLLLLFTLLPFLLLFPLLFPLLLLHLLLLPLILFHLLLIISRHAFTIQTSLMGQPTLTEFFLQCLIYLLTSNLHIRREISPLPP